MGLQPPHIRMRPAGFCYHAGAGPHTFPQAPRIHRRPACSPHTFPCPLLRRLQGSSAPRLPRLQGSWTPTPLGVLEHWAAPPPTHTHIPMHPAGFS